MVVLTQSDTTFNLTVAVLPQCDGYISLTVVVLPQSDTTFSLSVVVLPQCDGYISLV